jgi:hypothetical protein
VKNIAKLIRDIEPMNDRVDRQTLYEMTPPLEGNRFVVVSAAHVPYSGPETYIFPADEDGEVTTFRELDGSYKGGLSHKKALEDAGYVIEVTNDRG